MSRDPCNMKWTKRKQAVFLDVVRATGNISAGARAASLTAAQAYSHRKKDQAFRAAWDSALQGALDDLEGALRRCAVDGVEKAIYYGGKQCGASVTYSDNLGMFLLRGRRKDIFGDGRPASAVSETPGAAVADASPRERLLAKLLLMSQAHRGMDSGGQSGAPDQAGAESGLETGPAANPDL